MYLLIAMLLGLTPSPAILGDGGRETAPSVSFAAFGDTVCRQTKICLRQAAGQCL
jgi:hypothetical protein